MECEGTVLGRTSRCGSEELLDDFAPSTLDPAGPGRDRGLESLIHKGACVFGIVLAAGQAEGSPFDAGHRRKQRRLDSCRNVKRVGEVGVRIVASEKRGQ
jgi:hypothetical protein